MRVLIVANPRASRMHRHLPERARTELADHLDVTVEITRARGHAVELANSAAARDTDALIVLGGDGTVNEVIQALAGTDVRLGVVPAGGANVLARSIGLPNDPRRALRIVADQLRADVSRRISLGRADDRRFVCNAGFGFDAAAVRHVEERVALKRSLGQLAFVWAATREWFRRGDAPPVELRLPNGATLGPLSVSIVANSAPYTYLGSRAMQAHPSASFDHALDVLAIGPTSTRRLLQVVRRAFNDASHVRLDEVTYLHDLARFSLHAPTPLPLIVDGDVAGEHRSVEFNTEPGALRLLGGAEASVVRRA